MIIHQIYPIRRYGIPESGRHLRGISAQDIQYHRKCYELFDHVL